MKLFILTHCSARQNYIPHVYKTYTEARLALRRIYNDLVFEYDLDSVKQVRGYIDSHELYDTWAEIVYTDDTYDRFDISEVEID